jgi:hypothetical protein
MESIYLDFLRVDQPESIKLECKLLVENCHYCGKSINTKTETFVSFGGCGHQFHGKCLSLIFVCPGCEQEKTELPVGTEPTAPIVDIEDTENGDTRLFFESEQRPFAPMVSDKPARDLGRKLSEKAKQLLERAVGAPIQYDIDYFLSRKITVSFLITQKTNITLLDLYHIFDVTQWSQLLQLQLKLNHCLLEGSLFPVSVLATHYHVDYFVLKSDYRSDFDHKGNTLLRFLAYNRLTTVELKHLGLTFDLMIEEGLTKEHLKMWTNIPFSSWISQLGATKRHFLTDLAITHRDAEAFGWNPLQFQMALSMNSQEYTLYSKNKKPLFAQSSKHKK